MQEAKPFLEALGIRFIKKSLQMAYDEEGYKYEIPVFCISMP